MFIDSFSEWEDEDQKTAHRAFTLTMRRTLRSQGCYVPSNKLVITRNLRDAAQDPDLTQPQNAITQQITKQNSFIRKSRFYGAQDDGTVIVRLLALQSAESSGTVTIES